MRFVGSQPKLDDLGENGLALLPTDPEDMWHAHNLISPEDTLKAHAIRKVIRENQTGSTTSERKHADLTIRVTSTFFDPAASQLHVTGTVTVANSIVNLGQYHTLDLALNRPFTLWKRYGWDSVARETLADAVKTDTANSVAAVVMQEGIANICLITEYRTVLKQQVESSIPKKRSSRSDQDSGMRRFFDKTLQGLMRNIDFSDPRPLLLASPGFVAVDFKKYIRDEGSRLGNKTMSAMAAKAEIVHTSSGHLHSLDEVLKSPEVMATMKDMKFSKETRFVDNFFAMLRKDDGRAWYGTVPVEKAVREGAVGRGGGVLLVNNSLFRSIDIATRNRYVALVDKVKADGGEARILSSDHESGQRLDALGGIAAILTYPLADLDEDEDENEQTNDEADSQEMII